MPLSEHEQRLLDQIERALYQEDPKFASSVRQTDLRTHMKRRLLKAAFVFVVGFGLLIAGLSTHWSVGIAGFAIMVSALLLAMTAWKRMGQGPAPTAVPQPGQQPGPTTARPARPRPPKPSGGVMGRFEERWKRRWDERGQ